MAASKLAAAQLVTPEPEASASSYAHARREQTTHSAWPASFWPEKPLRALPRLLARRSLAPAPPASAPEDGLHASDGETREAFVVVEPGVGAAPPALSLVTSVSIIGMLTGVMFVGSMSTGVMTLGLPRIAEDLALPQNLLLWPASVYPLASGCCLVLSGCLADFLGNRSINLVGCLLLSLSTLAVGLSRTGIEAILFRAFQGIAVSLCLPTAFSILTSTFAPGRLRNIGFSCLGLGQPLGFSVGMVLGGTMMDSSLTWRFAMYLTAGLVFGLFLAGLWKLPRDKPKEPFSWGRLAREIDWIGVLIISSALGIASYVFAMITADTAEIRAPLNIALIVAAGTLAASFGFWMHYQEKSGRVPLIPNSLWSNAAFTTICIMVLLAWAVMNSLEYFFSLFFQEVQHLTPLEAAIRFFPNIILGVILNFATGLLVHKIRADYLVLITTFLSAVSPLLMAVINPDWSFWYCAFWAVLASPLSADVIFTVANLVITDAFSPQTQALAGAVFNTVAQFGVSLGLMLMAIISSSVTMKSSYPEKLSPDALMDGYRAVFWACFAMMLLACVVGVFGLRRVGKVGLKRE